MNLPEAWLGAPAHVLPARRAHNDDVVAKVRALYRGDADSWRKLERRIRFLFAICGSEYRYVEDAPSPVAGHAAKAAVEALRYSGIDPTTLDAVLYTGIARDYFEPATAAEVAGRIGAPHATALDVGAACAGMLVGVYDIVARMALDPDLKRALVCAASMTGDHLRFDIQHADDMDVYGAGLTVGNASTAWTITREQCGPGGRVRGLLIEARSEHEEICRTPTSGPFMVRAQEMFALQKHVPAFLRKSVARAGWEVGEVDLWVSHQPSNRSLRDLAEKLNVPPERFPQAHQRYGNTETSSVPGVLRMLIDEGRIKPGHKLVLGSAAAGFVLASVMLEWGD